MNKPYTYNKLLQFLRRSGNKYQTNNSNTIHIKNGYLSNFIFTYLREFDTSIYIQITNTTLNYSISIPEQNNIVKIFNKMFIQQMLTLEHFDLLLKQIIKNSDNGK